MVEIPATAMMAEQFAREADFFSVGTNDLTQYTLAMDRGHPKLAPQVDALNPAVLQLIALAVQGAQQHDRWVGLAASPAIPSSADPDWPGREGTQRQRTGYPGHQGPDPHAEPG
jgi:phosphocarrier protein FPr